MRLSWERKPRRVLQHTESSTGEVGIREPELTSRLTVVSYLTASPPLQYLKRVQTDHSTTRDGDTFKAAVKLLV
jgi:hypothetical protein